MECKKKILKIGTFLLVFIILISSKVFATEGNITIDPVYQEITLLENQATSSAQFTLTNTTGNTYNVSFMSQDIQSMDEDGNIILGNSPLSGTQNSVATYLHIPNEQMILSPNEKLAIPITVQNTQDLSPGGHYGAVTTTLTTNESTTSGILPAVSSFFLVKKMGGERYHLSLNKISHNASLFKFPNRIDLSFSNLGNIHTTPRGIVKVTNIFGKETARAIVNEGSSIILPQSTRTIQSNIRKTGFLFPLMIYSLTITGSSDPGNVTYNSQLYFLHISQKSTIILFFFIVLLLFFIMRKRKKHD